MKNLLHRIENLPIVFCSFEVFIDPGSVEFGSVQYVNDAITQLSGWTLAEIVLDSNWWFNHIHPDDRALVIQAVNTLFTCDILEVEYRLLTKSQGYITCQDHLNVHVRKDNHFEVLSVCREIIPSNKKIANDSSSYSLFESVANEMPLGIVLYQQKIVYANTSAVEFSGLSINALKQKAIWELVEPEHQPAFKSLAEERIRAWQPAKHHNLVPSFYKGLTKYFEVYASSVEFSGQPAGLLIILDKTHQVTTQAQLALKAELLSNTYDAIFAFDLTDFKIRYVNKKAVQSLGYTAEELLNASMQMIVRDVFWQKRMEFANKMLEFESCSIELEHIAKDGTIIPIETHSVLHLYQDKPLALCVARDISLRVQQRQQFDLISELYTLQAAVGRLVTQVKTRQALCNLLAYNLVENSSIEMAMTGLVHPDTQTVEIQQQAGVCTNDANFMQSTVDSNFAQGAIVAAVRLNELVVIADLPADSEQGMWSIEKASCGFVSCVVLPMRQKGKVIGVIALFSKKYRFNSSTEKALLTQIVDQLNFLLDRFEEQSESFLFFESVKRSPDWMMICDQYGLIEFVNDSVTQISGYTREALIGQKPSIFKSGHHDAVFYRNLWQTIQKGEPFSGLFTNKKRNGDLFIIDETIVPIQHCNGYKYVSLAKDLSREIELKKELSYLANYDPITQLPNRHSLIQRLEKVMADSKRQQTFLALMVVDIQNFAMLNDAYDFAIGNEILQEIGQRLQSNIRENDLVARFGSDEFAILLQGIESTESIYVLANMLFDRLKQPILLGQLNEVIQITGHCGVATFPDGANTVNELVHNVDLALMKAKRSGENIIQYYEPEMNSLAKSFLAKQFDLQMAVNEQAFEMHFQPYFAAKSHVLVGMESLIRWRKAGQLIYPQDFIGALETSGLILQVEDFVLEYVMHKMTLWQQQFPTIQRLAINLSAVNFKHQNLLQRIQRILQKTRGNPHCITFEVVESALIEDKEYAQQVFTELRTLGFKIAIDDFGTGYSSFAYLLDLPADYLKIDISFVQKISTDNKALGVVESIIGIAHKLGMQTIAEGVEDEVTYRLLMNLGCDIIQGYYKARPMAESELFQFMDNYKAEVWRTSLPMQS